MKMILSGMNLVMTIIGFAVSMMFIVFVCTRLICARIQLRASRNSFPLASGSDLSVMERGLHGLEARLIASFPTTKFGDHVFAIGRDTLCTICLSEYQVKDVLRVLPYCGHAFHVTCIDIWLKQHSTCPVCRISLLEPADTKLIVQPTPSVATRSSHLPETFPLDSDHSSHADHGYSDRMIDNQSMGSTQSDQQISEPSGARGMTSTEVPSSAKNVRHQEREEKNAVSPPDL